MVIPVDRARQAAGGSGPATASALAFVVVVAIGSYASRMRGFLDVALVSALCACVDPLTTQAVNSPEWDVKNVRAYADTAAGAPDTTFAWGLTIGAGTARWRECEAIDACGAIERECPAQNVLAVAHVGQATLQDGRPIDVLKVSLAPRRKYIVPMNGRTR